MATRKPSRRRCKGLTRAGKPCKATPPKGAEFCRAHDPDTPASTRFGSPEQASVAGRQGGRPRQPRVTEVMRERVEAQIDDILAPYFASLTKAVVHAKFQGHVFTSDVPDLGARIDAAEKLLDRVYGRPVQRAELSTAADRPLRISHELLTDPELRAGLQSVKRRLADARAVGAGGPGSGDGSTPSE